MRKVLQGIILLLLAITLPVNADDNRLRRITAADESSSEMRAYSQRTTDVASVGEFKPIVPSLPVTASAVRAMPSGKALSAFKSLQPMKVASASTTVNLRGVVLVSYDSDVSTGMNKVPIVSTASFDLLQSDISATYGGVEIDGYYYANEITTSLGLTTITTDVYDTETWEIVKTYDHSDYSLMALDLAYDSTTGYVFGCFYDAVGTSMRFGYADFSTMTVTELCSLEEEDSYYMGIAADTDGTIYGIDRTGMLYTIDKTTGESTEVGSTGLAPYYVSSATIDPVSQRMFFTTVSSDNVSGVYEIDKTTGVATLLNGFESAIQICGIYVAETEYEDSAPAAVSDLSVSSTDNQLIAEITFTAPTNNYDGSEGSGDLTYIVTANSDTVATGSTTYGAEVEILVEMEEDGLYEIAVSVANTAGSGPASTVNVYLGNDTPAAPSYVGATYSDGVFSVVWTAVSKGVNGGYVDEDEMTYTVTRYPDDTVVAEGLSVNYLYDEVTEPEFYVDYYYGVTATSNGLTSAETVSETVGLGTIATAPYTNTFDDEDMFNEFTVVDANEDGKTWEYKASTSSTTYDVAYNASNTSSTQDDWLITRAIYLERGKSYEVTIGQLYALLATTMYTNYVSVSYGTSPTVDAMTTVLQADTAIIARKASPASIVTYLVPEKTGTYYIGIHQTTLKTTCGAFHIDDFSVGEGVSIYVPGLVSDVSFSPDANGAHALSVSFTAPSIDIDNNPIDELEKIEVSRDGVLIQTFENPTPGEVITFDDTTDDCGTFVYSFVAYNNVGAGRAYEVTSDYVGVYIPDVPEAVYVAEPDNNGTVTVSWTAVTTDVNGKTIPADSVSYTVYEYCDNFTRRANKIRDTSLTYQAVDPTDMQDFFGWYIEPSTEGGTGDYSTSDYLPIGTPYEMPYVESFTDGYVNYTIAADVLSTGISGESWGVYYDGYFYDMSSYDDDNGYLIMGPSSSGYTAAIIIGKINITGTYPALTFYTYLVGDGESDLFTISVRASDGSDWQVYKEIDLADYGEQKGWQRISVPLTDLIGQTRSFRIEGTVLNHNYLSIDNMYIGECNPYNLAMNSIEADAVVIVDTEYPVTLSVFNDGLYASDSYTVSLYRNDEIVSTFTSDNLEVNFYDTFTLYDSFSITSDSEYKYYAVINCDEEDLTDNVSDTITVSCYKMDYPIVTDLSGEKADEGAVLVWTEPDLTNTNVFSETEDFESYEGGATEVGEWTFIDADGNKVGYYSDVDLGITYLTPQSFFVIDGTDLHSGFAAHSGVKLIANMYCYNGEQMDDWAITPQLSGEAQTVLFFAKSYSPYYLETFEVLYSTTGTETEDFILIDTYEDVENSWKSYIAELPEGALYLAIRCISSSGMQFLVDDVTYKPATNSKTLEIEGYNVYRDNVKINSDVVTETSYVDADYTDVEQVYNVSVVYNYGESDLSNSINIDVPTIIEASTTGNVNINVVDRSIVITGAEDMPVSVYSISGKVYYSGTGEVATTVAVQPGVYVARAGGNTVKVVVR